MPVQIVVITKVYVSDTWNKPSSKICKDLHKIHSVNLVIRGLFLSRSILIGNFEEEKITNNKYKFNRQESEKKIDSMIVKIIPLSVQHYSEALHYTYYLLMDFLAYLLATATLLPSNR